MATTIDLQEQIVQYQKQLDQVNEFLLLDEHNEQFLQLKSDLLKAIALTGDLIKEGSSDLKQPIAENDSDDASDDEEKIDFLPTKTGIIEVGENIEYREPTSNPSTTTSSVEASERVYAGILVSILKNDECKIRFFETDSEFVCPISCISRIPAGVFTSEEISPIPGFKCQCKYSVDQQFYAAEIVSQTPLGYSVRYLDYGNLQTVPIEYLRPLFTKKDKKSKSKEGSSSNKSSSSSSSSDAKDTIIPIPEKLKILPTDTEEERQRKKKRIKAIKSQNRLVEREQEAASTQNSWQKFVTKGAKRALPGVVKSSSIFASSDEIGAKVGVVGSGKGVTEFAERKKHISVGSFSSSSSSSSSSSYFSRK